MEHGSKNKSGNAGHLFNKSTHKEIEDVMSGELYEEKEDSGTSGGSSNAKTKTKTKTKTKAPSPKLGGR